RSVPLCHDRVNAELLRLSRRGSRTGFGIIRAHRYVAAGRHRRCNPFSAIEASTKHPTSFGAIRRTCINGTSLDGLLYRSKVYVRTGSFKRRGLCVFTWVALLAERRRAAPWSNGNTLGDHRPRRRSKRL